MTARRSDDGGDASTEAAAWLVQRDAGFSRAQEDAFQQWRSEHPGNEEAVLRLEATWGALEQLRDVRSREAMRSDPDLQIRQLSVPPAGRFAGWATVAIAASAVVAAVWWWQGRSPAQVVRAERYETGSEGYRCLTLEDGSVLRLNADTSVTVAYSDRERRLSLERGEAHFSVSKDPERPFRVRAGGVAVRALGTAFNVRMGRDEIEILVTQGRVEVSSGEIPAHLPGASRAGMARSAAAAEVSAGQRAVVGARPAALAPAVDVLTPEAIQERLSWQNPQLDFRGTPLRDVVGQFNQRNQVQIVLADAELGDLPIGGSFRAENVDAFVRLLTNGDEITAEVSGPNRVTLRKSH